MKRPPAFYEAKARTVAALANPIRLALVDELSERPASAGELVARLGVSQPLISQHLAVLRAAGVVARERRARSQVYRLADPKIAAACGLMGEIMVAIEERRRAVVADVAPPKAAAPLVR